MSPSLDTSSLLAGVTPIIEAILDASKNVGDPLLELEKPIPGLSDLAKQEITILDIAEAKARGSRAKKSIETVRKFINIYKQIQNFLESFGDEFEDGILVETNVKPSRRTSVCTGSHDLSRLSG